MKRSLRPYGVFLQGLVLLGLIAVPAMPAHGLVCCSTVWDCVATVASQGVTCIIQIHVAMLRDLIRQVERERYDKDLSFSEKMAGSDKEASDRLNDSQRKAEKAIKELEEARSEARKIVGDDVARWQVAMQKPPAHESAVSNSKSAVPALRYRPGAPITQLPGAGPPSTPPQNVPSQAYSAVLNQAALRELANDNSLESMRRQIEEERLRGHEARQRLNQQKEKAAKALYDSREAAKIAFRDSFLRRIDRLLAALQAALLNPLEATKLIEGAFGILDGIVSGYDREVTPAVEKDAAVKQASVATVERPAAQAQKHADRARVILAEMRKSARFQTVAERRQVLTQLNAFLSTPPPAQADPAIRLAATEQMRIAIKKTSADLRLLRPEMQRIMTAPAPDLRSARAQTGQHFDQFFKGKAPAEARKTRDELLMEARRRFAADPKLLASVEKLILEEARARGAF